MCDGVLLMLDSNSAFGMKARFICSHSLHMSAMIVCCVTNLCHVPHGMGVYIDREMGVDIMSGVLFQVTCRCVCGDTFSARLAVGFLDTMILGVSVICGMVSMGIALIIPLLCLLVL